MGCGSSSNTVVHPLTPEEVKRDEDETGSKLDGRGDSAVSKGTADSGVVMDNRETSDLPGTVPRKLPPVTRVIESETDGIKQDGLLQEESAVQERQNSSEILEELLLQGIIPAGQSRERSSGAGEAFSIMLSDSEGVMRRPPARLESLRAKKAQNLPSREEIDEKMRLADERRRLKEEKLKTRLRYKSARVRGPAPVSSMGMDAELTPVETLQSPLIPDTPNPPPQSQIPREAAEGGELVREAAGDGRESQEDTSRAERRDGRVEGGGRGESTGAKRQGESGDGEEEVEFTQVEELKEGELLTASGELECDTSFQQVEEMF
ncbi:stathmin domain-containing protein 1 [Cheilinus undulatus]|uniref:stathmin domain-containing protein 1 n=1 Tax=Cheilinus undulatus TaxID=241271 RepID=UPI001BD43D7B|nr:stathmin domain-containing protein 1 [Cheilinus undulatus]